MRQLNIERKHKSDVTASDEAIEIKYSDCRMQDHSSGRTGGISHQSHNRGFGISKNHSAIDDTNLFHTKGQ